FVAHHRVSDNDPRLIIGFSLHRSQASDHFDSASALAAADDLPIAQASRFAQKRLQMVQEHREHETKTAATDDLFAEQGDRPWLGLKRLAKEFGLGLE